MTTVEFLAEWMIRSAILIAGGALLLWLLRVKDASIRAAAWTGILCGSFVIPALAIPALTSAFPKMPLPAIRPTAAGVVIRPAEGPVAVSEPAPAPAPSAEPPVSVSGYGARTVRLDPPATRSARHPFNWAFDWMRAALMFYAAACGAMLLRICAGLLVGLRLLGRSRATGHLPWSGHAAPYQSPWSGHAAPYQSPWSGHAAPYQSPWSGHAAPYQFTGEIEIRESGDLAAPLTLGILRPAIVLPADWRAWNSTKLEAVLAHERSHVQRRDPWVQLLSGIHRALLWGSPLSWFLHQRIVQTAEEASDDAAVTAIHDRVSYAETLLDFMQRGVWKTGFVGVSMARYGSPEKRIRRVLNSTALSRGVTGRGVAAIVAVVSPLAYVIATAQVRPQFEIADVHVSALGTGANQAMRGGSMRAGMYQIQSATMVDLIKTAYGVDADKVLGGPSWLELDRYDVFAKGRDPTSADAARLMLQALLADRFKLVLHRDSRPLPGFALTVGKGGAPKLKKAAGSGSTGCKWTPQYTDAELGARRQALNQAGDNSVILMTYLYTCQNMTMAAFAEGMRSMVDAQQYFDTGSSFIPMPGSAAAVVDRTGLSGEWDFNFKYTSRPPLSAAASGIDGENITIVDAIEKQLGLKLEAAKIPTPVIIVDSVNRKPTDNPPDVKAILPPPPPAAFEAATLRLSDPNAPEVRSRGPMPGGRFEVRNFPLNFLITMGWGLGSNGALKGTPPWLNSIRVDLTAKLPSTESTREIAGVVDMDAFVPALKALLTERFKVAIHTEQQPVPGYALVAAKPKMRKADPLALTTTRTKCFEGPGADGKDPRVSNPLLSRLVTCQNITMQEFAKQLAGLSGPYLRDQIVVDASGIEGAYDFTVSFSARVPPAQAAIGAAGQPVPVAPDPDGLTLFDALEKQLGLKLEKRNIPAPVVILDHIEEKPTDN